MMRSKRLEMTKNGAEPGRSRMNNAHLKALQYIHEGLNSSKKLGSDVDDVEGEQLRHSFG